LPAEVAIHRVALSGYTRRARIWSFAANSEEALRGADYDCTVGLINTWFHDVIIPQGGVQAGSLECNARRFPAGWRRRLYVWSKIANPKFALYERIERKQYDPRRGAKVVAVSRMVQEHLERFRGVDAKRIRVIPNAIDAGRMSVDDPTAVRRTFRAQHGLEETDLVALFAGHNFRLKGLLPLLEALASRERRDRIGRPIHLLACGGGSLATARRWLARLGLSATVHLIGFAPSVAACYHASDFFVLPTYYDPCSLAVFEALACGLPVITTAYNGASELLAHGREGYVISGPGAREELIAALDSMTDDESRRRMAAHARRLGHEQSFDRHVSHLVELFEEVAVARRKRSPHVRVSDAAWTRQPR
jgi:UDP-glucose:(heptosyl)LPS alpha-1,3-glucosyltransferase